MCFLFVCVCVVLLVFLCYANMLGALSVCLSALSELILHIFIGFTFVFVS